MLCDDAAPPFERRLGDVAKSADKGGRTGSGLDFFLIGEGPADGNLVRIAAYDARSCMEIELRHGARRQSSAVFLDRLDHIRRFASSGITIASI